MLVDTVGAMNLFRKRLKPSSKRSSNSTNNQFINQFSGQHSPVLTQARPISGAAFADKENILETKPNPRGVSRHATLPRNFMSSRRNHQSHNQPIPVSIPIPVPIPTTVPNVPELQSTMKCSRGSSTNLPPLEDTSTMLRATTASFRKPPPLQSSLKQPASSSASSSDDPALLYSIVQKPKKKVCFAVSEDYHEDVHLHVHRQGCSPIPDPYPVSHPDPDPYPVSVPQCSSAGNRNLGDNDDPFDDSSSDSSSHTLQEIEEEGSASAEMSFCFEEEVAATSGERLTTNGGRSSVFPTNAATANGFTQFEIPVTPQRFPKTNPNFTFSKSMLNAWKTGFTGLTTGFTTGFAAKKPEPVLNSDWSSQLVYYSQAMARRTGSTGFNAYSYSSSSSSCSQEYSMDPRTSSKAEKFSKIIRGVKAFGIKGELYVSAFVNNGMLTVTIDEARSLVPPTGLYCNSYARASIIPDPERRTQCKSAIISATNQPIFNESFTMELLPEDYEKRLLISVWHRNNFSEKSALLGCMAFSVRHLLQTNKQVEGWYFLLAPSLGRRKHLAVDKINMTTYYGSIDSELNSKNNNNQFAYPGYL